MLRVFKRQIFQSIKNSRRLNTWSHLALAFNSTVDQNYLLDISKKETVKVYTSLLVYLSIYLLNIIKKGEKLISL